MSAENQITPANAVNRAKIKIDHRVESVALADMKPHPRNYREHPDDQLSHIIESLRENGFYRNIVIAKDGTILAGHGVYKAAKKIGLKKIPAIRLNIAPDDASALKVLTGDNEIARLAELNDRALTEMLKELKEADGLLGTGYDEKMLAALVMVTRPAGEIQSANEAAEWVGMPEFGTKDPSIHITVVFRNQTDRVAFVEKTKLKPTYKTESAWTAWWPDKPRDDLAAVKFKG